MCQRSPPQTDSEFQRSAAHPPRSEPRPLLSPRPAAQGAQLTAKHREQLERNHRNTRIHPNAQAHPRVPAQLKPSLTAAYCCSNRLRERRQQNPQPRSASRGATTAVTRRWHCCALGGNRAGDTTALSADAAATHQFPLRRTLKLTLIAWKRGEMGGKNGKKGFSTVRKFCLNADSLGFYPAVHNTAPQPQNIWFSTKAPQPQLTLRGASHPGAGVRHSHCEPASSPAFVSLQQLCDPKSQFHELAGQR